jgi:glutamine amidotransferase
MARLFGYFANQADRIRCALAFEGAAMSLGAEGRLEGWGVGSYQGGEVLLRRRPIESREGVEFSELVRDLRTDAALVYVREGGRGPRTMGDSPPFRFRQWLFAPSGAVPGLEALRPAIVARLPDFLQRAMRSDSAGELLFSLFLAGVHETGRLDDGELDRRSIGAALQQMLVTLDAIAAEGGHPPASLACLATNHHAMVALSRGVPLAWVRRQGIRDCAACRKRPDVTGREPKRQDHEQLKYVLVAAGEGPSPSGFYALPESPRGAILALDNVLDAQVSEL